MLFKGTCAESVCCFLTIISHSEECMCQINHVICTFALSCCACFPRYIFLLIHTKPCMTKLAQLRVAAFWFQKSARGGNNHSERCLLEQFFSWWKHGALITKVGSRDSQVPQWEVQGVFRVTVNSFKGDCMMKKGFSALFMCNYTVYWKKSVFCWLFLIVYYTPQIWCTFGT